jgi:hypothetical protein
MEAPEASCDLVGDARELFEGYASDGPEAFEEVFAFKELHNEVGDAALNAAVLDVNEVFVS